MTRLVSITTMHHATFLLWSCWSSGYCLASCSHVMPWFMCFIHLFLAAS